MNICVKSSIPIDLNSPSVCKLGSNTLIHLYDVVNYPNLTKYVFFLEKIQNKNTKTRSVSFILLVQQSLKWSIQHITPQGQSGEQVTWYKQKSVHNKHTLTTTPHPFSNFPFIIPRQMERRHWYKVLHLNILYKLLDWYHNNEIII